MRTSEIRIIQVCPAMIILSDQVSKKQDLRKDTAENFERTVLCNRNRIIFFIERYEVGSESVILKFLHICISIKIEDAYFAIIKAGCLFNPDEILIMISRLHAENKSPYEKAGKEIHGWTAGRYRIMGMTAENIAEKRCYTVKEVQEMLGISRPTVYELLKKNEFRWIQIGNKYRISKKSFDEWLDQKSETI